MPSRREMIAMSPDEIVSYLQSNWRATLATVGRDYLPHLAPMNYLFRDGAFFMTTFRKSQKVRNLERNPRATLLVETGKTYDELQSVSAYADCEIVDNADFTYEVLMQMPGGPDLRVTQQMGDEAKASAAKRVALRLTPFRFLSWDHRKLGGHY